MLVNKHFVAWYLIIWRLSNRCIPFDESFIVYYGENEVIMWEVIHLGGIKLMRLIFAKLDRALQVQETISQNNRYDHVTWAPKIR